MGERAGELKRRAPRRGRVPIALAALGLVAAACGSKTTGDIDPLGLSQSPHRTVTEHADNHQGVPVFSDNRGSALKHDEPARIPYGTAVEVECYAPNESGMGSINVFYKIEGGTWNNDFASANTFDNGAGMGPTSVDLDPRVLPC